jgi:hypothetical protein
MDFSMKARDAFPTSSELLRTAAKPRDTGQANASGTYLPEAHKLVDVWSGRVEDGRGSLGHSATLRFPSPLIEPDVPD